MFKQLNAGILSLGLMSTMTAPLMAQDANSASTNKNLVPTNQLLVENYSNLATKVSTTEPEANSLTIKNKLNFTDFTLNNSHEELVHLEDFDLLAQRRSSSFSKYKYSAGLDLINFGWVKDNNGAISSVLGFNAGIGIGYRKYFKPARDGQFNFSYTLATVLVVFPIAGIGADYQWDSGWYVGAHAFFYPFVLFFDDFFWPVWPAVVGGYRWE